MAKLDNDFTADSAAEVPGAAAVETDIVDADMSLKGPPRPAEHPPVVDGSSMASAAPASRAVSSGTACVALGRPMVGDAPGAVRQDTHGDMCGMLFLESARYPALLRRLPTPRGTPIRPPAGPGVDHRLLHLRGGGGS